MMLGMSQEKLGDAFSLTFSKSRNTRRGANRISASRLQQSAHILQVPVAFFFEGAPRVPGAPQVKGSSPSPAYVSDFLATREGLTLVKAFMRISLRSGVTSSTSSRRLRATNSGRNSPRWIRSQTL